MRETILWAPDVGKVSGCTGEMQKMKMLLSDREANGEAFPGEKPVRLPRREHYAACHVRHADLPYGRSCPACGEE